MIRSVEIVDPLHSPISNALGAFSAETSAAFAPTGCEDATTAFGVPAVEDHEVPAAGAHVNRMVEVRAAAGAVRLVEVNPGGAATAARGERADSG